VGYQFSSWEGCRAGTGGPSPDCFVDSYAPLVTVIARFTDVQNPSVSLQQPDPGAVRRGVVTIGAAASDNTGIARVDFSVSGTPVGSAASPPYQVQVDTTRLTDGPKTIEARAVDPAGNATSDVRAIAIDNTAPSLRVSGPSADQTIPAGQQIVFSLGAGDASGIATTQCSVVAKSAPGPTFGACTGGPTTDTVRIDTPGTYAFNARAVDTAGNATTSAPLTFAVVPPPPAALVPPAPGPVIAPTSATAAAAAAARAAARRFLPIVRSSFQTSGSRTRFLSLGVSNAPGGSRVQLSCRGSGCPFTLKRFTPRAGKVNLLPALKSRRLRPGARIEVKVTGSRKEVKVVRLTIRRGRAPLKFVGCAPAGGGRLGRCA
jgi:hypothetical protein